MQRRKFIVGVGSLAAGSAAAVGTGAFSSVQADRSMKVNIAGDSNAYLKFDTDLGNAPDDNYEYAEISSNELNIKFGENNAGGQGVNPNAVTYFDDVFALRNQGTEDVEVWFELSEELQGYIDIYPIAGNYGRETSLLGESNAFSAPWATGVGSSLRVGIKVDTRDVDLDGLEGEITVHAESV